MMILNGFPGEETTSAMNVWCNGTRIIASGARSVRLGICTTF